MSHPRSPFRGSGLIHLNLPGLLSHLDQAVGLVDGSASASAWVPRVDVRETNEAFIIHADVPGVSPDALDIHMDQGALIIKGARQVSSRQEGTMGVRVERPSGKFQRQFLLPDTVDAKGIQASYDQGVLEVVVPKKPEEKPQRVEVKVSSASRPEETPKD